MIVLQIEHNVSSYDGWKNAFDNDPINRKKSGVKRYQVYQSVEDPNYVVIDLYFDSLEESAGALNALQKLWSQSARNSYCQSKSQNVKCEGNGRPLIVSNPSRKNHLTSINDSQNRSIG
jgi:hypothetical protein